MNESEPPATQSTSPDTPAAPAPETASPAAEPEVHPAIADLSVQLAAAQKEAANNYDRYVRSVADLDNFRRRTMREKEELRQFAASKVLEDLLPVLDNLGLGLAAAKEPNADIKTFVGGIAMVAEQLKTSLVGHGLKEINPLGQPFDPNFHEALSQQSSAEVAEGSVVAVIRTGYSLNGRLLRPASVVVSSGVAPVEAQS